MTLLARAWAAYSTHTCTHTNTVPYSTVSGALVVHGLSSLTISIASFPGHMKCEQGWQIIHTALVGHRQTPHSMRQSHLCSTSRQDKWTELSNPSACIHLNLWTCLLEERFLSVFVFVNVMLKLSPHQEYLLWLPGTDSKWPCVLEESLATPWHRAERTGTTTNGGPSSLGNTEASTLQVSEQSQEYIPLDYTLFQLLHIWQVTCASWDVSSCWSLEWLYSMDDTYVTILHYTRDPNGILSAITKVIGPAENMISAECKIRNGDGSMKSSPTAERINKTWKSLLRFYNVSRLVWRFLMKLLKIIHCNLYLTAKLIL